MKRTNTKPLETVPGDLSQPTKSKGFVHNATDTFSELFLILVAANLIGATLYSIFENQSFLDSVWWSIVTGFTVGYGDVVPQTMAGRVIGTILMSFTVFVMIPLITARMASKMIVNDDAFTHSEQEDIKNTLHRVNDLLDNKAATVNSGKVKATRVR